MIATRQAPTLPTGADADRTLEAAVRAFAGAERCRTGHYLECGRLLQSLLESRCAEGARREAVLKDACRRLQEASGLSPDVWTIVQVWNAHALLAGGRDHRSTGLPWRGYRYLRGLVRRADAGDRDCNAWHVNPDVEEEAAVGLYRRWAAGHPRFSVEELAVEVKALVGGGDPPDRPAPRAPRVATGEGEAARQVAELVRREEDVEAVLFDAVLELRGEWKPSFSEAVVQALAEAGLRLSLERMHQHCEQALANLNGRPRVA